MDITGAEIHLAKIISYLESVRSSNPEMYKKTQIRLFKMSNELYHAIDLLSDILEIYSISAEDDPSSSEALREVVNDTIEKGMETSSKIENLSSLVDCNSGTGSTKLVFKAYRTTFLKLNTLSSGYIHVDNCGKLIWRWFNLRFIRSHDSGFHYRIQNIPKYVRSIVIAYGIHLRDGTIDQFVSDFNVWLDQLICKDGSQSGYAVPYEIYRIGEDPLVEDINVEAIQIWDKIYEPVLSYLSSIGECSVNSESVYNFFMSIDSGFVDRYDIEKDVLR